MSQNSPRAFISYSWSSPVHEKWVLSLAEDLRAAGVDAILDKWDLREGHDAVAFMEKMVTDTTIGKVIIVADKAYAEKTDARRGGVGTEAQIISSQIYQSQAQSKFVAVVREIDDDGIAYVPTYYRSRIHIDMSEDDRYSERFEQLLRWIFDKPLYLKPEVGDVPLFLEQESRSTGVRSRYQRRAVEAVLEDSRAVKTRAREYTKSIVDSILGQKLDSNSEPFDEAVVQSIDAFHGVILEFADYCNVAAGSMDSGELVTSVSSLFEELVTLIFRPDDVFHYREWDWDNWKFMAHEMFIYMVAALLKHRRLSELTTVLDGDVYFSRAKNFGYKNKMVPVSEFYSFLRSLEHRSDRLGKGTGSKRTSIHADMLKARAVGSSIDFESLMQADFFLFLRGLFGVGGYWWPISLLYSHNTGPFEVFARARSRTQFEQLRRAFNVESADAFRDRLRALLQSDERSIPQYGWHRLEVWELSGAAELATAT